jgi:hypothetical protein
MTIEDVVFPSLGIVSGGQLVTMTMMTMMN